MILSTVTAMCRSRSSTGSVEAAHGNSPEHMEEVRTAGGIVVEYAPGESGSARSHERLTRAVIARKLAELKGFDCAGEYDPAAHCAGSVYFVPHDTVGIETARELGIRNEHDLFGGVVPHPFMATKVISHPLVEPEAVAPEGWSHEFLRQIEDAVLTGFSAFTLDDVRLAGKRLLEHGPVRLKPARKSGGRGQRVIQDAAELDAVLAELDPADLARDGIVLEENLTPVTTYSVGQVCVSELVASYYGTQRLTRDHDGTAVYGGSDLTLVRGNFAALLRLDVPEDIRLAVEQGQAYDAAAIRLFPGMFASRRNYDIAQGRNRAGHWRSGVLEQSWRMGGASGAEIAALEAFRARPGLDAIRASTIEIFGESEAPPPHATVYFRGHDAQVGPMTKYALVEPYGYP